MRILISALVLVLFQACDRSPPSQPVDDAGTDSDTDADADSDADTDSDTDTDNDTDSDTETSTNTDPDLLDWVEIPDGIFWMGTEDAVEISDEYPYHEVTVPPFEMTVSEITMGQYAVCVDEGACTEPMPDTYTPPDFEEWEPYVTWGKDGYDDHPINCVNWFQAVAFCEWAGGRLPSEAEWEYAARSLGQGRTYPWGEAEPTCEYAIIWEWGDEYACDAGTTWPVCSRPAGSTEQGLCDMTGGVAEWVEDCYQHGYQGAPTDGSARLECFDPDDSVYRGGSFDTYQPVFLRTTDRDDGSRDGWLATIGFRCAR